MKKTIAIATLILTMLGVTGCGTVPIMNVSDAAVTSASGKPLTLEQVRGAIVRAGATLGWQMKDAGPGLLVGTLNLRSHQAVVDIPYSTSAFSIKYRSSVALDERDGSIHKNYNGWITNLTRAINAQISGS